MQFWRRFGAPIFSIGILIGLSVLAVVSVGEVFKLFVIRGDGVRLRKRDGSTITFNMPWNPPNRAPHTEIKALDPVVGGLLNAVEAVASALLDDGSGIASNVQAQASILTATIVPIAASSVLVGGSTQVPTALAQVTSAINQATGIAGGIVSAANNIVASAVSEAANAGASTSAPTSNASPGRTSLSSTSEPQEFLPQTRACTTCNSSSPVTALPFNPTAAPVLSSASVIPVAPCSPSLPACTGCPLPVTQTCTVTETWHSTHYAETATYFSFIAAFTVTCTETISVCPSPANYLPMQPAPTDANSNGNDQSSNPCPGTGYSCSECPNGWFCPPSGTAPQSAPCGFGWGCAACGGGFFCVPNPANNLGLGPVSFGAGVLSSPSMSLTDAGESNVGSFTAQPPSLASTLATAPLTTGSATVTCVDGSVVISSQNCLNGVAGATSSLRPLGTSSVVVLSQATSLAGSAVGGAASALNPALSNVNSALAQISGLTGDLLSTIAANVASELGAGNSLAGNLPSATSALNPALANVNSALAQVSGLTGGLLSTVMANVASALGAANGLVGNLQPSGAAGNVLSNANALTSGLLPQATDLGGNFVATGLSIVGNVGGSGASLTNVLGNANPTAALGNAGNLLSNANGLAGNLPQATAAVNTLAGGIITTALSLAGNVGNVASVGNIVGNVIPAATGVAAGNILSNANGLAGNILPQATAAVPAGIVATAPPIVGNGVNGLGNAIPTAAVGNAGGLIGNIVGGIVPAVTPAVGNVVGNGLPATAAVLGNAGGLVGNGVATTNRPAGIIPVATAAVGNLLGGLLREVKKEDRTIDYITTIVNGRSTVLPIVTTTINGVPTAVAVVNMFVNKASTDLPVASAPSGLVKRLLGRAGQEQEDTVSSQAWYEEADFSSLE